MPDAPIPLARSAGCMIGLAFSQRIADPPDRAVHHRLRLWRSSLTGAELPLFFILLISKMPRSAADHGLRVSASVWGDSREDRISRFWRRIAWERDAERRPSDGSDTVPNVPSVLAGCGAPGSSGNRFANCVGGGPKMGSSADLDE
jgi:hypothetical protein